MKYGILLPLRSLKSLCVGKVYYKAGYYHFADVEIED